MIEANTKHEYNRRQTHNNYKGSQFTFTENHFWGYNGGLENVSNLQIVDN